MLSYRYLLNLSKNCNIPLDEATFYGKNEKLLKAEKIIAEMKKCYTTKGSSCKVDDISFHKHSRELEDLLAELFGFSDVYINRSILGSYHRLLSGKTGAFTYVNCMLITDVSFRNKGDYDANKEKITDYHNGVRFKKGSNIACVINIDNYMFISNEHEELNFNEDEILAILLHEIGHNFYNEKNKIYILNCMSTLFNPKGFIEAISEQVMSAIVHSADKGMMKGLKSNSNAIIDTANDINYKLDKYFKHGVVDFLGAFSKFLLVGGGVVLAPFALLFLLLSIGLSLMSIAVTFTPAGMIKLLKQDHEKFSDSFATAYGYGPQLSSALIKFEDYQDGYYAKMRYESESSKKCMFDIFDSFAFILELPLLYAMRVLDPHPRTESRIHECLKYLENSAENIDNPRLRQEYEKNLEDMKTYKLALVKKGDNSYNLSNKERSLVFKLLDCKTVDKINEFTRVKKYNNLDF